MDHLLPAAIRPHVSIVVSREAGHSPWLTFLRVYKFPGAMKKPNLENPYGAKRCAAAIISMFHFPDDEFHEMDYLHVVG